MIQPARRPVHRLIRLIAAAVLMLTLMAGAPRSLAQDTATGKAPMEDGPASDEQDLRDLLTTLEDDASRQAFLETLRTALDAQSAGQTAADAEPLLPTSLGADVVNTVSQTLGKIGTELTGLAGLIKRLPDTLTALTASLDTPAERKTAVLGVTQGILALLSGLLAHGLAHRLLRRPRNALKARTRNRWTENIVLLAGRLVLCVIPPMATVTVAWSALPLLQARPEMITATILVISAIALLQTIMAVTHTLLAPNDDRQRLLPLDNESAHYLILWIRRLSLVGVIGFFGLQGAALLGLPHRAASFLQTGLGLLLTVLVLLFIVQNRQSVGRWLRTGTQRPYHGQSDRRISQRLRARLADIWHILAMLYVTAIFIIWAAEVPGGFLFMLRATALSALIIGAASLLSHALKATMERAFHTSAETPHELPGQERPTNRYASVLDRLLHILLGGIAFLALLQAWGLDTLVWLTQGGGQRLTSASITIGLVVLLAIVAWEVVSSKIERYFSATDAEGNTVERSARAKTLLPLARNVLLVALVIVVALIVLSEVGVNIAPLLAGAGVIGLAIGFGSQKLVQDVITGAFILFEDTMAVGDVVQVGSHAGVVESLSIRSLRLRDLSGSVHTVPFSSVDTIVNMTKDFSYYLMEVGVAYREDTDEVAAVLNDIAEEMRAEDYFHPLILEPLEILGVDKFADSAVILKARIKTLPIRQWEVGREFNRRMKKAFDARGIEIPFPHQTLYFGTDKDGKAPPAHLHMNSLPAAPDSTLAPLTHLTGAQTSATPDGDH